MFQTDPGLVPVVGRPDLWWLDGPLVWTLDGLTITIPTGLVTDDASIPKIFDWIPALDRQGLTRRPGVLHDGLYSLGRAHGKEWADHILFVSCCAEGLSPGWASVIWYGVHWGGNGSWEDDATNGRVAASGGNFIEQKYYDAYQAAGGTLFRMAQ